MASNKKAFKSPLEKTQLNRINEEQELKQCKRSGDNIASLLRRRALFPNPGLVLKGSRGRLAIKRTKSTISPHSPALISRPTDDQPCPPMQKHEPERAPLRAQSVQNISKIPSSTAQGSVRAISGKKKNAEEKIKRAFSAQNVATINLALKPSNQVVNSKAVTYNAELLMKFDEEKKALDAKICELSELVECQRTELENLRRELEEERERRDGGIGSEVVRMEMNNESQRKQMIENAISAEHFTDSEKLFLIGNIDPGFGDISILESYDDSRGSADDINDQRYVSARDDMSNSNLDRHNSMSVDRGLNAVSIADLTDRFLQMQEAQHSVNEELQATLQELSDLQENVSDLNEVNDSLVSDNDILLESLCGTTDKLNNARIQVENLKSLLIRDIKRSGNNKNNTEQHLAELLVCAQQEKEELLLKQSEYLKIINSLESDGRDLRDSLAVLKESQHLQEEKNSTLKDENSSLELQLDQLSRLPIRGRDPCLDTSSVVRLDNLLRQKEDELERIKQTSFETIREFRQHIEFLKEKIILQSQYNKELDREFKTSSASLRQTRAELNSCKKSLSDEREEWEQFRSDLLTAVVVANNLNMEKDNELKRMRTEHKDLMEKYQNLVEHVSSKGLLDDPVSVELLGCHSNENDDEDERAVEVLLPTAMSKEVINRNSNDILISNEMNSFPLQADHSPVKNLPENLPLLATLVNSASNGFQGVTVDDVSKIPGILLKNLNCDRRDEKEKSSTSYLSQMLRSDPLNGLVKTGGSKRNALLTWCQNKLKDFNDIEVTNFSSSWNDGMSLCALLHTYLPHDLPYADLKNLNVKQRFQCAFKAAKDAGLELGSEDDVNDLVATDRPAWQMVYALVTNIYKHFEVDTRHSSESRRNSLHQR